MWEPFRDLFYLNGKKHVTMEMMNMISHIGLSVWFLDKGGVSGNRAYIRIANLDEHDLIQRWFSEVRYACEVRKKMIVFTSESSVMFLKDISTHFPLYLLSKTNPYPVRKYL